MYRHMKKAFKFHHQHLMKSLLTSEVNNNFAKSNSRGSKFEHAIKSDVNK